MIRSTTKHVFFDILRCSLNSGNNSKLLFLYRMFWGNFPKMLAKKNSRVFALSLIEGKTLGKLKVEHWNYSIFLHLLLVRKKHDSILSFSLGCGTSNSWNTFFPQWLWNLRASSPCRRHIGLVHRFVNFLWLAYLLYQWVVNRKSDDRKEQYIVLCWSKARSVTSNIQRTYIFV